MTVTPRENCIATVKEALGLAKTDDVDTIALTPQNNTLVVDALAKQLHDPLQDANLWQELSSRIERQDYATEQQRHPIALSYLAFRAMLTEITSRQKHGATYNVHPLVLRHAADLLNIHLLHVRVSGTKVLETRFYTTFAAHAIVIVSSQDDNDDTRRHWLMVPLRGEAFSIQAFTKPIVTRLVAHQDGLDMYETLLRSDDKETKTTP